MADITVSFDGEGKIRVLDVEKYEQTKQLQDECAAFSTSKFCPFPRQTLQRFAADQPSSRRCSFLVPISELDEFTSTVHTLTEVMNDGWKDCKLPSCSALSVFLEQLYSRTLTPDPFYDRYLACFVAWAL